MTTRRRKSLNFDALRNLIDELKGVRGNLPSPYGEYIENEEDDEDYELTEPGHIESEDVEVGINAALSTATNEFELVEEPNCLSDLFAQIFSSDDEIVGVAINFEDAVNGYFGELFGEDLSLANSYLTEIITTLEERIGPWTKRKRLKEKSTDG